MAARERRTKPDQRRSKPATTPQARENQLVSAAFDLAEKQIEDGTASSQVLTHFLKLGSSREELEQAKIAHENELLAVKKEAMESAKRVEELYMGAIEAMKTYSGNGSESEDDGED